ncbi:MAG: hypothetical protein ACRDTG_25410 [Pseudonocardiaceae bacterium]
MSAPGMWWGRAAEGCWHAVASCDIAPAADRGGTEALCGWRLPVDVALLSEPDSGILCAACHLGATADLESSDLPVLAPFGRPGQQRRRCPTSVRGNIPRDVAGPHHRW